LNLRCHGTVAECLAAPQQMAVGRWQLEALWQQEDAKSETSKPSLEAGESGIAKSPLERADNGPRTIRWRSPRDR
jgi:hypothetical protein